MRTPSLRVGLCELLVGGLRVARFAGRAVNLLAILMKLQDFGWPGKLHDPLGVIHSSTYGGWLKTAAQRRNWRQNSWLTEFRSHPRQRAGSRDFRLAKQSPNGNRQER
jgi:hypothetical protein